MLRSTFVATLALSLSAGSCLSACNTADPQEVQSAGTVSLPLTAVGTSGARYHLKAFFYVRGGSLSQPLALGTSSDPAETELTASLDPGDYTIELNSGWTLMREDGAGGLTPVEATLESAVLQNVRIKSKVTTTVTYRFKVNGQVVETGPGTLSVGIAVDDVEPAGGYYQFGLGFGYAWVATDALGTIVTPKDFSSVTTNGPFCIKGEVMPAYEAFAIVGINLNQPKETGEPVGVLVPPPGSALVHDISNDLASPLRMVLAGPSGQNTWCLDLPISTAVTGAIALEQFNTKCWLPSEGVPYRGEALESVAVYVPGTVVTQTPYSFCVKALGIK